MILFKVKLKYTYKLAREILLRKQAPCPINSLNYCRYKVLDETPAENCGCTWSLAISLTVKSNTLFKFAIIYIYWIILQQRVLSTKYYLIKIIMPMVFSSKCEETVITTLISELITRRISWNSIPERVRIHRNNQDMKVYFTNIPK